jgi:hypothetical protein
VTPSRYEPVYLLELRLGGDEVAAYSGQELSLTSREDGGSRTYSSGLSDVTFVLGADAVSVTVRRPDVAVLRARVGPLVGRPFALRLHRGEASLEDALVVLQGIVTGATWADPEDPDALLLSLRRAERELTSDALDPQAVVDENTWPDDFFGAGTYADPAIVGEPYPLVFGAPGRQTSDSDTSSALAASPALQVEANAILDNTVLIAGHHVEAEEVYLWNLSESGPSAYVYPVANESDALGRDVALVHLELGPGTLIPSEGDELLCGWSPRSGKGRGALLDGQPVAGLGDLLLWGARNRSRAVHDLARMRAEARTLNRFQVDAVVNERGLRWSDWLARNVLDLFGVELVSGPRGWWYREVVYLPDAARVRASLVTSQDGSGIRVQRAGGITDESTEDVANEVTVAYAPYACSGSKYVRRVTLGATATEYVYGSGDSRLAPDRLCRRSAELFGAVSRTWTCGVTWDPPTAQALARKLVERYALPAQVVTYTGGPELADLEAYDTVEITDTSDGAVFDGALGVVQPGIRVGEREVAVTVRVPELR